MPDNPDATMRVMIMRSFLAQSGARSPGVALMMLRREYPDAPDEERQAAIDPSRTAAAKS